MAAAMMGGRATLGGVYDCSFIFASQSSRIFVRWNATQFDTSRLQIFSAKHDRVSATAFATNLK